MDTDTDPTPFFSDFNDGIKLINNVFFIFLSYNLTSGTLKFCVKILFCKHYFSPFMRKGEDPDPGL
jgi:hypothetical protein